MSKTSVSQTGQQQFGWDTTSHDYNEHLSKLARTPTQLPEGPRYPSVHTIFKNKLADEEERKVSQDEKLEKQNPSSTKVAKKVNVTEQREIIGEDKNGKVLELSESVDAEAKSFIKKKQIASSRRSYINLYKWKTFKM